MPKTVKKSTNSQLTSPDKIKLLFTIVERSKADFYVDVLENFEVNMQYVIFGRGTAPAHLEYLSLGEQNKAVIISVIKENRIQEALSTLEEKFQKSKHGKGIAYTIPLSSVIGVLVYQFLSNNATQIKKGN